MNYYKMNGAAVLSALKSSESGLTSADAVERLSVNGENVIVGKKSRGFGRILFSQIMNFSVLLLVVVVVIALALGKYIDASVIGAIVILNALFGTMQEHRVSRAIEAIRKLIVTRTVVLRDGHKQEIDARLIVPGDIVILSAGSSVPADCYILKADALKADESRLTGESVPVDKMAGAIEGEKSIAERKNLLYSSTMVTAGKAVAVVIETGMKTEIGKVAALISRGEAKDTPLQKRLNRFSVRLGLVVVVLAGIIFAITCMSGCNTLETLIVSISLAVAAIPEGLPAVVTVCLAVGVGRMVKRGVLVRRLSAVETLGGTTVICTDKTGTLTLNEMMVKKIYFSDREIEVGGSGYETRGDFSEGGKPTKLEAAKLLFTAGALCNDAYRTDGNFFGDPTEIALLVAALKAGVVIDAPRVNEEIFTSEKQYMATENIIDGKTYRFVKGAPEKVLAQCGSILFDNGEREIAAEDKKRILDLAETYGRSALRVIGFAYAREGQASVFLGLMGMMDALRPDVAESIALCRGAGVRVVMITGDHPVTARAIGEAIGIDGHVMTGDELAKLTDEELAVRIEKTNVFARVSAAHKVRILKAFQRQGQVVAMTGDGVNDAPALSLADIGIAVSSSTDVAREAADMVLTDNHFKSIVHAIEEGRGIFENIRKFIKYLLSCNLGELFTIFGAVILGLGLPLTAIQILWMNLVTDGLPALALGLEPLSRRAMKRPPRDPQKKLLDRHFISEIVIVGLLIAIFSLVIFYGHRDNMVYAQSLTFTALVVFQLIASYSSRTSGSILKINPLTNPRLLLAIAASLALQLIVLYTPVRAMFHVQPVKLVDWLYILALGLGFLIILEAWKALRARFFNHQNEHHY